MGGATRQTQVVRPAGLHDEIMRLELLSLQALSAAQPPT
jgi:hypothetical protein